MVLRKLAVARGAATERMVVVVAAMVVREEEDGGPVTVQILAKCRDGGGVLAVVAAPLLLLLRSAPIWLRHGGSKMEAGKRWWRLDAVVRHGDGGGGGCHGDGRRGEN